MEDPSLASSLLAEAVEISAWLEADRATAYSERLHRDRSIGRALATGPPLERVRAWWRALGERDAQASRRAGRTLERAVRLERARRSIGLVAVCIGAVFGAGTAAAIFHYDGTWPVNVVTVLAVLVLLQLLLVALTLVLMLPRAPGVRAAQDLLGSLNPGALIAALAAAVYRRVRHDARAWAGDAGVDRGLGSGVGRGFDPGVGPGVGPGIGHGADDRHDDALFWRQVRGPASARFARWQVLAWSQSAAIAFNVSALGTAIALIAFTDLAFGWSTTLRLSSEHVLRVTNLLAAPWQSLWPQAVPSAELVESSRFFRLASAPPSDTGAQALTGWWPFLLAAMLAYGLLPRCLLRALAAWRLRAAARRWPLEDPQVQALLERMSTAEIALGAQESAQEGGAAGQAEDRLGAAADGASARALGSRAAGSPAGHFQGDASRAVSIVWAGALPHAAAQEWTRRQLGQRLAFLEDAGGGRALAADAQAIARLAALAPASVLVFVRAWEAPLLDLRDFLASLRAALGAGPAIVLVPVGAGGEQPDEEQQGVWSRWLTGIADPALYLETCRDSGR